MKSTDNQDGFSLVEVPLSILVVSFITFAGWYVWNSSKEEPEAKKTVSTTQETSKTKATTQTKSAPSLEIKELGIKVTNLPESLYDLTYRKYEHKPEAVYVTTKRLASKACDCSIRHIIRYDGVIAYKSDLVSPLKQFDGFWIGLSGSTGACTDDESAITMIIDQEEALNSRIKNGNNIELIQ